MKSYLDNIFDIMEPCDQNLLILNDQMSEPINKKSIANIIKKVSHHRNVKILYLVKKHVRPD